MSRQWIAFFVLALCTTLVLDPGLVDWYSVYEPADDGELSRLSFSGIGATLALACGWIFGEEVAMLVYIPAIVGATMELLFKGVVQGQWPGDTSYFGSGNAGDFLAVSWVVGALTWAIILSIAWLIVRFAGGEEV